MATDYSIEYPVTKLTGLRRGESVTVNGCTYTVRENPRSELNGTRLQVYIAKV
jgi:riboflavin synthase alpha subunit